MSRMRVRGVLAVNSALKDGSLRPIPPFNNVELSSMRWMQYLASKCPEFCTEGDSLQPTLPLTVKALPLRGRGNIYV